MQLSLQFIHSFIQQTTSTVSQKFLLKSLLLVVLMYLQLFKRISNFYKEGISLKRSERRMQVNTK